jgi:hypothetical protein
MTQVPNLPPELRSLMESAGEIARRWRQRADELRTIASNIGHPSAAKDLMALAERWDAMAERAEQRAGTLKRSA